MLRRPPDFFGSAVFIALGVGPLTGGDFINFIMF